MPALGWITLAGAIATAALLIPYLIRRPALDTRVRIGLFLGLGVLPLLTSVSGTAAGFESTKQRGFCSSCHVMEPWTQDAANPLSTSLAAAHSRNALTGEQSCYACHANYSMFGAALTKLNGMKHVWHYLTHHKDTPVKEFVAGVSLYSPYPNQNCTHCHSMQAPRWRRQTDHAALLTRLQEGKVSCASEGCHGSPHPFKPRGGEHAGR